MQEGIGRGQSADSAAISLPAHKGKEAVWIAGNDAIEHLPVLVLDPSKRLRSWYPDTGAWTPKELTDLTARLAAAAGEGWGVRPAEEVEPLGGQTLFVPDLVLDGPRGRRLRIEVLRAAAVEFLLIANAACRYSVEETAVSDPCLPGITGKPLTFRIGRVRQ